MSEITTAERIVRSLRACNRFQTGIADGIIQADRLSDFAAALWAKALVQGVRRDLPHLELFHEDSGSSGFYDRIGIGYGGEYASVSVNQLSPIIVTDVFKRDVKTIDKQRSVSKVFANVTFAEMYQEFIFLMMDLIWSDIHIFNDDIIDVLPEPVVRVAKNPIPSNPLKVGNDGEFYPCTDERMFQTYKYKGYIFRSWITLESIFEKA